MPLVDCTECGDPVSNLAQTCPKCGAPVSKSFITDVDDLAKDTVSTGDRGSGRLKTSSATIYLLHIATVFFNLIPFVVAIILTRNQIGKSKGTWLESHFDYHKKTNRVAVMILGIATLIILIITVIDNDSSGLYFVLLTPYLMVPWLIYRSIRGGMALFNNEEIGK